MFEYSLSPKNLDPLYNLCSIPYIIINHIPRSQMITVHDLLDAAKIKIKREIEAGKFVALQIIMVSQGMVCVVSPNNDEEIADDRFNFWLSHNLRLYKAESYLLIMETWATIANKPIPKTTKMISDLPLDDRHQVVIIVEVLKGIRNGFVADIYRPENTLGEFIEADEIMENTLFIDAW